MTKLLDDITEEIKSESCKGQVFRCSANEYFDMNKGEYHSGYKMRRLKRLSCPVYPIQCRNTYRESKQRTIDKTAWNPKRFILLESGFSIKFELIELLDLHKYGYSKIPHLSEFTNEALKETNQIIYNMIRNCKK